MPSTTPAPCARSFWRRICPADTLVTIGSPQADTDTWSATGVSGDTTPKPRERRSGAYRDRRPEASCKPTTTSRHSVARGTARWPHRTRATIPDTSASGPVRVLVHSAAAFPRDYAVQVGRGQRVRHFVGHRVGLEQVQVQHGDRVLDQAERLRDDWVRRSGVKPQYALTHCGPKTANTRFGVSRSFRLSASAPQTSVSRSPSHSSWSSASVSTLPVSRSSSADVTSTKRRGSNSRLSPLNEPFAGVPRTPRRPPGSSCP